MAEPVDPLPQFSVVVPAYNTEATVAAAVRSVIGQTQPDLEVIVIDDGSTDATAASVESIADPRLRVLRQPNRGLASARNAGMAAARGRYITLLDSDDLYLPRYLELTQAALESSPDVGIAYTDAYVFDASSGKVRRRSAMARSAPPVPPPPDRDGFLIELLRRNFVYVAAAIPRHVIDAVGGFDESRTSAEDYELWLRILIAGYRAVRIEGQQALYRKHPGQMSRDLVTMTSNLLAVYEGLRMEDMPSDAHRDLLAQRRHSVARELRILTRVAWLIPQRLITALKRAGIGESWYDPPPAEVLAAFPDLAAL
jgi:GT2 family glycosyltransferase